MEKLSQQYIMTVAFRTAVDREELFIRKCKNYYEDLKKNELKEMLEDMENTSQEHIKMLKDKMTKLNITY